MIAAGPDHDRLLDEAIDLVIRYQNDPENPVSIEMIRAWRLRSDANEAAWAQVSKVHGASGKILTEKRKLERRDSLGLTRRNVILGGLGTIGMAAGAYAVSTGWLGRSRADYITIQGEIRSIGLPDGSKATLGPASAIALDFSAERRRVDLLSGMSFFEVTSRANGPFSVLSQAMRATAYEAAFDVSRDAGVLSVAVDHGLVEIGPKDGAPNTIGSLAAGEWITIDPSSGDIQRGKRDPRQIASWRNNLIIAERETISALAARIGRWMPGRILIADPFIGKERVSGVFDLNDPLRALQAVVHPAGARVRQITPYVTIISSV
jgi:transmembrane sensor